MCAGLATLKELNRPGFYEDIGSKTNWLVNEMRDILDKASIPFRMQSVGGMFGLFFIDQDVYSFTDALNCNTDRYAIFFREMLNQGIYLAPSAFEATFMSAAHSESDLEKTRNAFKKSIDKVVG